MASRKRSSPNSAGLTFATISISVGTFSLIETYSIGDASSTGITGSAGAGTSAFSSQVPNPPSWEGTASAASRATTVFGSPSDIADAGSGSGIADAGSGSRWNKASALSSLLAGAVS